jgi:hypothetical protein
MVDSEKKQRRFKILKGDGSPIIRAISLKVTETDDRKSRDVTAVVDGKTIRTGRVTDGAMEDGK